MDKPPLLLSLETPEKRRYLSGLGSHETIEDDCDVSGNPEMEDARGPCGCSVARDFRVESEVGKVLLMNLKVLGSLPVPVFRYSSSVDFSTSCALGVSSKYAK